MQSIFRKQQRIDRGLQNPNPNSTKISKHTEAYSEGQPRFRKGRFAVRNQFTKIFKETYLTKKAKISKNRYVWVWIS